MRRPRRGTPSRRQVTLGLMAHAPIEARVEDGPQSASLAARVVVFRAVLTAVRDDPGFLALGEHVREAVREAVAVGAADDDRRGVWP